MKQNEKILHQKEKTNGRLLTLPALCFCVSFSPFPRAGPEGNPPRSALTSHPAPAAKLTLGQPISPFSPARTPQQRGGHSKPVLFQCSNNPLFPCGCLSEIKRKASFSEGKRIPAAGQGLGPTGGQPILRLGGDTVGLFC